MPKIFISYRRDDSQHQADRLHAILKTHVRDPKSDIFIDVDNIPVGADFIRHLDSKVAECDVLLALIGPDWLKAGKGAFRRRLDDPNDFVRIEIASALKRGIPVAPVLLDGADMPKANQLPDDLKKLVRRQAAEVRRVTFDADAERLIQGLQFDKLDAKAREKSAPKAETPLQIPNPEILLRSVPKTERPAPRPSSAQPAQRKSPATSSNFAAPIIAVVVLALLGGGAWLWLGDPFGWRETPAISASPADRSRLPAPSVAASTSSAPSDLGAGASSTPSLSAAKEEAARNAAAERDAAVAAAMSVAAAGGPIADRVFRDCPECPEMLAVPAGTFKMGASFFDMHYVDEGPQHLVSLRAFAAGKYEVTWDEWNACVSAGGCPAAEDDGFGQGRRPVTNVSWNDARRYAAWLSDRSGKDYRLLSEAEWEYASRAGTTTVFFWGSSRGRGNANCKNCGSQWDGKETAPVGSFSPNSFGFYDMHGNVVEWVEDCYAKNYDSGQPVDGRAFTTCSLTSERVSRGGSWYNEAWNSNSANRSAALPEGRFDNYGFRVARTLP